MRSEREIPIQSAFAGELQKLVLRYSLSWLAAGSMVGLLIALLLFRPTLGTALGEFTYGRWVPVHLNFQLYGWSSLPIVGVLLKGFLRPGASGLRQANLALGAWSMALGMGGVSWLAGETSGKLFLDWAGMPRLLFMLALALLWAVLVWNYLASLFGTSAPGMRTSRLMALVKGILLAGLAVVPWALYHVSQRQDHPAIDPGTGGPTGSSLLISTLGIVLVIILIPRLLSLRRRPDAVVRGFWIWFAAAGVYFLTLDHGNSSHRDWRQIGAVAMLLGGAPTLIAYLRQFQWNENARPWLTAVLCWWGSLVVMGFIVFLPGVLDRVKFTHALIAHADLAMPGLVTSLNMLILAHLAPSSSGSARAILGRPAFWLWQGALALQIVLLLAISAREGADSGELWKLTGHASLFFTARLITGISMGAAALLWVWSAWTGKESSYAR